MNLPFDPNVGIYFCPKQNSNNSVVVNLSESKNVDWNQLAGFFKCASIFDCDQKYVPCLFTTDSRLEFYDHVKFSHKKSSLFCFYCAEIENLKKIELYDSSVSLNIHLKEHHKNRRFQCNVCPYRALTADHVNLHQMLTHKIPKSHGQSSLECVILKCPNRPFQLDQLKLSYFYQTFKVKNLLANKEKAFQCLYCFLTTVKFLDLIEHQVNRHADYPMLYYRSPVEQEKPDLNIETIFLDDDDDDEEIFLTSDEDDDKQEKNLENKYGMRNAKVENKKNSISKFERSPLTIVNNDLWTDDEM